MYFHRKKSGTGGVTLQLLESYRKDGVPRHHVVVSLGDLDIPQAWDKWMASAVESKLRGELPLLSQELPLEASQAFDRIMAKVEVEGSRAPRTGGDKGSRKKVKVVDEEGHIPVVRDHSNEGETAVVLIDSVTHTHNTPLGPYLPGFEAWEALGMPEALRAAGLSDRQSVAAQALVIGKMADPLSEHAFHGQIPSTSLPDLLGETALNLSLDCLYRVGDKLVESSDKIEKHLRDAVLTTLGESRTILLYDLTNTHFEGIVADIDRNAVHFIYDAWPGPVT